MSVLDAFVLAVVQGLTEFLPVSSSGHLVLVQSFLDIQSPAVMGFDVYVHFGTLVSLLVLFWNDVRIMVLDTFRTLTRGKIPEDYRTSESFRTAVAVLVGTVPAGVVGVLFRHQIEDFFQDPKMVAVNLVLTGLLLFLTRLASAKDDRRVGLAIGFLIGIAQAIAILPGISRSGSTIAMGMFLGLTPVLAARFSFLLSVPVIAGAAILETKNIFYYAAELGVLPIVVGVVVAALSGAFAIKVLLKIVHRGKFSAFAFYCLVAGIIGILYL